MDSELDGAIQKSANLVVSGPPIVAFTGAGISVESGIPDFRSPGGLWSKYDPAVYCNFQVFQERPELFWEMAAEMHDNMSNAQPNPAHIAMAELEQLGLLSCIITQNVDNLHQQAGSKLVYELHGNASTSTCMSCKEKFATDELMLQLQSNKKAGPPKCLVCDGVIKMDAVLFGEALPPHILENAMVSARKAKVLLVVGTSLTAYGVHRSETFGAFSSRARESLLRGRVADFFRGAMGEIAHLAQPGDDVEDLAIDPDSIGGSWLDLGGPLLDSLPLETSLLCFSGA